jgi:phosphohistidine phosphatase SixA
LPNERAPVTEIVVVRHGQASFGQANYDALSALGHRQSQLLGEWLAAHGGTAFDRVLCGGMVRHRETLTGIEQAYAARDAHSPPSPASTPITHRCAPHKAVPAAT